MTRRVATIAGLVISCACIAVAFQESPSTALGPNGKRGLDMVANKAYEGSIRYLEEGARETPNNPLIYENLGIANLACSSTLDAADCLKKAEENMEKAIALGGQATFIVDRSLDKSAFFVKVPNPLHMKRGYLHISKTALVFQPENDPSGAITLAAADIKEAGMNSHSGKSTNVFHVSTTHKQGTYDFRTANFSVDEAKLLFRLMKEHLGVSVKD